MPAAVTIAAARADGWAMSWIWIRYAMIPSGIAARTAAGAISLLPAIVMRRLSHS